MNRPIDQTAQPTMSMFESRRSLKWACALAAILALGACGEGRDTRTVGSVFSPLCAPDGSVVFVQYSNTEGSFDNAEASRENCKNAKE